MSNTDKLKKILKNVIEKCDGITFYHIEIDGTICNIYKQSSRYYIESENYGFKIDIDEITNVSFDDDIFFATFDDGEFNRGINIMKDMSPQQIIEELA